MPATQTTAPPEPVQRPHVASCRHCGARCRADALFNDEGAFCCNGCASVYELIHSHGLGDFYACEVPAGVRPPVGIAADTFAVLDDDIVARAFVESTRGGIVRASFPVPGIHCASCVWLVEQLWRIDPGVVRAEVDLVRRSIRFEFRAAATSLRHVAEALASIGYGPLVDVEGGTKEVPSDRRALYLRIGLAGFAFGNVMLFSIPRYVNGAPLEPEFQHLFNILNIVLSLPVLLYSAAPWFQSAWRAARARAMTLDVPVALGLGVLYARSAVDIATGRGEGFFDSFSGLVFFLLIGRLFQQKAFEGIRFDRAARSFLPLSVRVDGPDAVRLTPIEQLVVGDVMIVRPHEVVPADAVLLDETGSIDYTFTTGESTPAEVVRGNEVPAGGRVLGRAIRLLVKRPVSQSRLVALWSDPVFAEKKAYWLADVASRFGKWFTILALGLAAVGAIAWWPNAAQAASVATAVLIIACPCALTLAAPITLGTAMSVLGRAGCYLKRPGVALDLSRIDVVAFDKTGTLTAAGAGAPMQSSEISTRDWHLVRRLAAESVHPVSRTLVGDGPAVGDVSNVRELPGLGLVGIVAGHRVVIGSAALVASDTRRTIAEGDHRTWIAIDGAVSGWIDLDERCRPGTNRSIRALSQHMETWLLSGDRPRESGRWAALFGGRVRFGMAPEDKLAHVRRLQAAGKHVLMVGDGLNDAGALAAADVGLAVSDETACLVPACDAVIRGDRVVDLPAILAYARRARRVIALCFAVSVAYNLIGLSLALTGHLTPLATAILMPVSSLTVVGLSVGCMRRGLHLEALRS